MVGCCWRLAVVALVLTAAGTPPRGAPVRETPARETGIASWYGGPRHEGRRMANGQRFHSNALTAASRHYPLGTRLMVCLSQTKHCVRVTVTDRGPYWRSRVLDLSRAAADALGIRHRGLALVVITTEP